MSKKNKAAEPPTITVRPIDLSQPGSYYERWRYLDLINRLNEARGQGANGDPGEAIKTMREADALIRERIVTPPGQDLEAVLRKLSANDFDALLGAIAFEGGGVPPAKPSNSDAGLEDILS